MSKDYTFNPGDFVVYPAQGVGKVIGIQTKTVAGQNLSCITVDFGKKGTNGVIDIPSAKALNNGLRQVATPVMMEAVERILKKKTKTKRIPWNKRATEYNAKIGSGDPVALAEVIRKLYKENQSFSEQELYKKAMDKLAPEYAIVHNIPETEACAKIEEFLSGADSAE